MLGTEVTPSVDAAEARALVDGGAILLDVREPDEWLAGHVAGATHIALNTLPLELDRIPLDKSVVCVCRVGGRSAIATTFLVERGVDAWNLAGGMQAWEASGLPVVTDDGSPGTVI
jgi:rhodanese-related sulfurtransferase